MCLERSGDFVYGRIVRGGRSRWLGIRRGASGANRARADEVTGGRIVGCDDCRRPTARRVRRRRVSGGDGGGAMSFDPAAVARLRKFGGDKLVREMINLFLDYVPQRV